MSQREYPTRLLQEYSPDRLYPAYYSEVDMSPTPTAPMAKFTREYRTSKSMPSKQLPLNKITPKAINSALKRLAIKANQSIKKTFQKDFSLRKFTTSVSSLPESNFRLSYSQLHQCALSARPALPRVPVRTTLPRNTGNSETPNPRPSHQRKPTGPRELPQEIKESKEFFLDELVRLQNELGFELKEITYKAKVGKLQNDSKFRAKVNHCKSLIIAFEEIVVSELSEKPESRQASKATAINQDSDDEKTTVPLEKSRSNSSDSLDRLRELTQKLVTEVSRPRMRRKTAHAL